MEVFNIPRRKVERIFGIARSTYYRWLHKVENGNLAESNSEKSNPSNKTDEDIESLVWRIFENNPHFGRVRISMIINKLNVFLSPFYSEKTFFPEKNQRRKDPSKSTVSISNPRKNFESGKILVLFPSIPNHVWSVDKTTVKRCLMWQTYILMAIDHYSRKVVCVSPLEGRNAGWTIDCLEEAIETNGSPKHIITDHESIFIGDAFKELLRKWNINPRLGAVGKHGSISVTERVIKTLKYEWLNRVFLIKNFDHLADLCDSFEEWYNYWQPHSKINGNTPDNVFNNRTWRKPAKDSKNVPADIETRYFPETRITAYRLKKAA